MTTGENLFLQGKIDEAYKALQDELTGRNCYLLGLIFREGLGHQKADEEKAVKYFRKGKEMGDSLCGIPLFSGEKDKEMWDTVNEDFSRILLSAQAGDVFAMDEAGLFYTGNGMILDYEEGMKWLAKGAFYEYWKALYDLGMAYEEGLATAPDEEKAKICFKKAAEYQDKNSEYELAQILDQDPAHKGEAIRLMEKSADHGNEEAAFFLGGYYLTEAPRPDPHKAFHWFETAARLGSLEAMEELSGFYEQGLVVPRDLKKAADILKDAYTLGNKNALFTLGLFYLDHGKEEEALPFLEGAARFPNDKAAYLAGMMYLTGRGTEENREKAIDYLMMAADLGNTEAEEELMSQGMMKF